MLSSPPAGAMLVTNVSRAPRSSGSFI